jgi:hypothetical protein
VHLQVILCILGFSDHMNKYPLSRFCYIKKYTFAYCLSPHTLVIHLHFCSICVWLYCPLLDLGLFFSFLLLYTVDRIPWRGGGSARRNSAMYTQDSTSTKYTHIDIHSLSETRNHNPRFRAREDRAYLRLPDDCATLWINLIVTCNLRSCLFLYRFQC